MAGISDALRVQLNEHRLRLIDETIREQVSNVLHSMEHYGWHPLIAADVWRSPRKQLEFFNRGTSKLRWGYHCASRSARTGLPVGSDVLNGIVAASLAADIIDATITNGWDAPKPFWYTLGYCAEMQGLGWGGYFGLDSGLRMGLKRWVRSKENLSIPAPQGLKLGWDAAHVETARVSVAQARRGLR